MQTTEAVDARFGDLRHEWRRAEQLLKLNEHLRHELIIPSINELRYCGRNIIDALEEIERGDEQSAMKFLDSAESYCRRAREDSVDAAIYFLRDSLKQAEESYGIARLLKLNPQLLSFRKSLADVSTLVVGAREDRQGRVALYDEIESRLPALVDFSEKLRLPPTRRSQFGLSGHLSWIAVSASVLALAVAIALSGSIRDMSPVAQVLISLAGALIGFVFGASREARRND